MTHELDVLIETHLDRVCGGENCDAIPVPPAPSSAASREQQMAGYQARGDAFLQRTQCEANNLSQINGLIAHLGALKK